MIPKNLTEEHRTIGALLRQPFERLTEEVYGTLVQEGFTELRPAHGSVFRYILPGGSRITQLASRAGMTKQSMGYLVDALAAAGYVEFVPDIEDGRAKLVCLTERGRDAQQAAMRISERREKVWEEKIGKAEYAAMRRTLEKLYDLVSG